ncbi:MAG: efflux RND transporter permease subunit [Puniceicoccaceae bacterium]|nr:MAG: efflux RND transporter permease subunit [Puniceicoccaceae bacterium]
MNAAESTIRNKLLSGVFILLILGAGWSAYSKMPRFEDPEFTIRTALVSVAYPGASPMEVAREIVEPLETAIQQLQEVESIVSTSKAGRGELRVDIKYEFSRSKSDLQIVWTKLRNRIADAEAQLPPGAGKVFVNDDYGDVYGFYYFITGPDYSMAELRDYGESLRDELLAVDGVAKVSLLGVQNEAIYVEISRAEAARLGLSIQSIYNTLNRQNAVSPAGSVVVDGQRLVVQPSGGLDSVEAVRSLPVAKTRSGDLIYLGDIAQVERDYVQPATRLVRYQGIPALALGVANVQGANVVRVGQAVEACMAEAISRRPLGMQVHEFYQQGKVVDAAIGNFAVNVIAALVIVIMTLLVFMGYRAAAVIGLILLLTVAATLGIMNIVGIPMHRISLGALIIALGMMVDNAIVVTEGILVGVGKGRPKLEIAKEVVQQTQWPLLGGTLVGILAFAPIGFAPGATAEYTNHLFWVILISLFMSWLLAITLTPLFCYLGFRPAGPADAGAAAAKRPGLYQRVMVQALRWRWAVLGGAVLLFAVSAWAFQFAKQSFFPNSTTPQLVVDFWLPEGTDIERTVDTAQGIEAYFLEQPGINAVQTLIGSGGLRYILVYSPESPNPAYAQFILRLDDYKLGQWLIPELQAYLDRSYPEAQAKVWRFSLGPGGGSKIEAELSGPDPAVLRQLAAPVQAIMMNDGRALSIKTDWRQPVSYIEPIFAATRAQRAGITRADFAKALQTHTEGTRVGIYREGDRLLPIMARAPASERGEASTLFNVQVMSPVSGEAVPATQLVDGFRTDWRDGILKREDRIWQIKVQCDPVGDELPSALLARLRPQIEQLPLPDGYSLSWGGEYGNSSESQQDLASTVPLGFLAMVLVVVFLFRRIRQPLLIWLVVPLSLIGVVVGLLATGLPLDFMGILGLLSLSGLLIKNAIVLVDQMDLETKVAMGRGAALIHAAGSRVRPVMMGTLTTVLGVMPLFFDAFFQSMAVVLVFGLSFATLLTLIVVPTLYAAFFRIHLDEPTVAHEPDSAP